MDILTTTDKIPPSTLTPDFLRGVYLAGTYAVSGIGTSLSILLLKAVVQNSTASSLEILKSLTINLSTQIILHTAGFLFRMGGDVLGDYMYVHGPMSAPAFGMILGAWYLIQRKNEDNNDDNGGSTPKKED